MNWYSSFAIEQHSIQCRVKSRQAGTDQCWCEHHAVRRAYTVDRTSCRINPRCLFVLQRLEAGLDRLKDFLLRIELFQGLSVYKKFFSRLLVGGSWS